MAAWNKRLSRAPSPAGTPPHTALHPRWVPELHGALAGGVAEGLAAARIREHPADAGGKVVGLEGLGQVARALVVHDVTQAAGAESHHGRAAGVGFNTGVGQVVLAGWHHQQIGGAVEGTQAEVVVQVVKHLLHI